MAITTNADGLKTETEKGITVGDKVVVRNNEHTYNTYKEAFIQAGLFTNYKDCALPDNNRIYVVVDIVKHKSMGNTLLFIKELNGTTVYLIGLNAVDGIKINYQGTKQTRTETKNTATEETEQELFAKGILPDNVKEKLVPEIIKMLNSYNYDNASEHAITKILQEWAKNKGPIIALMMNLPTYVEGKYYCVFDDKIKREFEPNAIGDFVNWVYRTQYQLLQLTRDHLSVVDYKKFVNNRYTYDYLDGELYSLISSFNSLIEGREVTQPLADALNNYNPDLKIVVGQKTGRALGKLFRFLGWDKMPKVEETTQHGTRMVSPFNQQYVKLCDALSPITLDVKVVLSANPIDYFLMSNGNSWASCHTIDKNNDKPDNYSGCYSSGTVSYMLDGSSLVMYSVKNEATENLEFEPKVFRQMFHAGEGKIVQGRLYPQCNDYCSKDLYNQFRKIVQTAFAEMWKVTNDWEVTGEASRYIISNGTHYTDYTHYNTCTLSMHTEIGNDNDFTVGHRPICIDCGNEHYKEDWITCCHSGDIECYCCGGRGSEDDMIWSEYNEAYLCDDCARYCEGCCTYYVYDQGTWIGDYWYSYDYLDNSDEVFQCADCDEYHFFTDEDCVETENGYICENCAEYKGYIHCYECGEWVAPCDVVEIDGDCYCPGCADYYTSNEKDEVTENENADACATCS